MNTKRPKRRFKGFSEDWEQEKLSNMANIVGGGTPSTKESSYWNGDINWFTPNEIGDSKYVKDSLRQITEKGLNNSSAQLLPANKTILFTSRATIGTIGILEEEASTNQGFQSLIVNDFNDVNFLYYKLLTMKKLFLKNSVGSTFLEISGKTMKKIDINIPSKTEQEKIGKLLSKIDKAISLHKRKFKKLKQLQKSYLNESIFSEPKCVPKRRFKGFSEDWEQRKLGNHAYIKGRLGWKNLKQNEYTDVGPSMIAGRHIENGAVDWSSVDHIPLWRYDESPEIMLQNDDIIFSKDGTLGNPAIIKNLDTKATINATMMLVRMENTIRPSFLFQILNSKIFERLIHLKVSGSSIPHLFQADMNDFRFFAPKKYEQDKITSILDKMDELITLHKNKRDTIQKIQKIYLQNNLKDETYA